ncbi:hypothetical protein IAR55_003993 [Kwoniella newhampshirensis]|uniref:RNase III domain-containing protein n=1 Tax=Kwoniella newhampshirensis TaxID=1651941 RepID=A0AAW0YL68_9TREE
MERPPYRREDSEEVVKTISCIAQRLKTDDLTITQSRRITFQDTGLSHRDSEKGTFRSSREGYLLPPRPLSRIEIPSPTHVIGSGTGEDELEMHEYSYDISRSGSETTLVNPSLSNLREFSTTGGSPSATKGPDTLESKIKDEDRDSVHAPSIVTRQPYLQMPYIQLRVPILPIIHLLLLMTHLVLSILLPYMLVTNFIQPLVLWIIMAASLILESVYLLPVIVLDLIGLIRRRPVESAWLQAGLHLTVMTICIVPQFLAVVLLLIAAQIPSCPSSLIYKPPTYPNFESHLRWSACAVLPRVTVMGMMNVVVLICEVAVTGGVVGMDHRMQKKDVLKERSTRTVGIESDEKLKVGDEDGQESTQAVAKRRWMTQVGAQASMTAALALSSRQSRSIYVAVGHDPSRHGHRVRLRLARCSLGYLPRHAIHTGRTVSQTVSNVDAGQPASSLLVSKGPPGSNHVRHTDWTAVRISIDRSRLPPLPVIFDPVLAKSAVDVGEKLTHQEFYKLALLGDRLFDMCAVMALWKSCSSSNTIASAKQTMIKNDALAFVALSYDLDQYIRIPKDVPAEKRQYLMASLMEAWAGAAWLDAIRRGQEEEVWKWAAQLFDPDIWLGLSAHVGQLETKRGKALTQSSELENGWANIQEGEEESKAESSGKWGIRRFWNKLFGFSTSNKTHNPPANRLPDISTPSSSCLLQSPKNSVPSDTSVKENVSYADVSHAPVTVSTDPKSNDSPLTLHGGADTSQWEMPSATFDPTGLPPLPTIHDQALIPVFLDNRRGSGYRTFTRAALKGQYIAQYHVACAHDGDPSWSYKVGRNGYVSGIRLIVPVYSDLHRGNDKNVNQAIIGSVMKAFFFAAMRDAERRGDLESFQKWMKEVFRSDRWTKNETSRIGGDRLKPADTKRHGQDSDYSLTPTIAPNDSLSAEISIGTDDPPVDAENENDSTAKVPGESSFTISSTVDVAAEQPTKTDPIRINLPRPTGWSSVAIPSHWGHPTVLVDLTKLPQLPSFCTLPEISKVFDTSEAEVLAAYRASGRQAYVKALKQACAAYCHHKHNFKYAIDLYSHVNVIGHLAKYYHIPVKGDPDSLKDCAESFFAFVGVVAARGTEIGNQKEFAEWITKMTSEEVWLELGQAVSNYDLGRRLEEVRIEVDCNTKKARLKNAWKENSGNTVDNDATATPSPTSDEISPASAIDQPSSSDLGTVNLNQNTTSSNSSGVIPSTDEMSSNAKNQSALPFKPRALVSDTDSQDEEAIGHPTKVLEGLNQAEFTVKAMLESVLSRHDAPEVIPFLSESLHNDEQKVTSRSHEVSNTYVEAQPGASLAGATPPKDVPASGSEGNQQLPAVVATVSGPSKAATTRAGRREAAKARLTKNKEKKTRLEADNARDLAADTTEPNAKGEAVVDDPIAKKRHGRKKNKKKLKRTKLRDDNTGIMVKQQDERGRISTPGEQVD